MYSFNTQKEIGLKFENFLAEKFKDHLEKLSGKQCDFITKFSILFADNTHKPVFLEVKNDVHLKAKEAFDNGNNPNFFIEKFSNQEKQTLGGCWAAHNKGADIFLYFFGYKQLAHFFPTRKLVDRMDYLIKEKILNAKEHGRPVRNPGYTTYGYKVPYALISDLAEIRDFSKEGSHNLEEIISKLLK